MDGTQLAKTNTLSLTNLKDKMWKRSSQVKWWRRPWLHGRILWIPIQSKHILIITTGSKLYAFLEYVQNTIFDLVKEKVVKFWVNKVIHLGSSTTNRVEPAHSRLKKYLTNSMSDLSTNRNSVHNILESQHTRIILEEHDLAWAYVQRKVVVVYVD